MCVCVCVYTYTQRHIYLLLNLVATNLNSCMWNLESNSMTSNQTWDPCIVIMVSLPLDQQGNFIVSSVSDLVSNMNQRTIPLFGKLFKDGQNWTLDLSKAAQTQNCYNSIAFLQYPESGHFLLSDIFSSFDVFHRYRVCVTTRVYLICSMYKWLEDFQSSSLKALSLGLRCNFHPSSHVVTEGVSPEILVEHWGLPR